MGRNIACGIATKINVWTKINVQDNKEKILNRIGSTFDLKYYDIVDGGYDDYICLYLKEDLFNEKFNELMKELANFELFSNQMYYNISFIKNEFGTKKQRKEKVINYLNNHFDLKIRKEYENEYKYFMDGVDYFYKDNDILFENYFYCTDMCDDSLFDDELNTNRTIRIGFNFIPIYFDENKMFCDDITFTLCLLNHFLRNSLNCELKNTLFFGLTD